MTFADEFPKLTPWGQENLTGSLVLAAVDCRADELVLRWFQRHGCSTLGEALGHSHDSVLRWRGIGVGKVAKIRDFFGRLQAELVRVGPPLTDAGDSWGSSDLWTGVGQRSGNALPNGLSGEDVPSADQVVEGSTDLLEMLDLYPLVDDRQLDIFIRRTLNDEGPTLEELGQLYGVTRERVRQLEASARAQLLRAYEQDAEWELLRGRGKELASFLGTCAPASALTALDAWTLSDETTRFLTWVEGYRSVGELLVSPQFGDVGDLNVEFLEDDSLFVYSAQLVDDLLARGVAMRHVREVMCRLGDFAWLDGVLVRRPRSIPEAAIVHLTLAEEPMQIDRLAAVAAPDRRSTSFRNALYGSDRFVRTSRDVVALAEWGLPAYKGVLPLMRAAVEGGPRQLEDIALELHSRFGVSQASVQLYSSAPIFLLRDGQLQLRPSDVPYERRWRPESARGLFCRADGGISWCITVDRDLLRGSGRAAPSEVAVHLGVDVGEELALPLLGGTCVVSWSWTSHTGPRVSSLRHAAEQLGATEGQILVLHFDHAVEDGRRQARAQLVPVPGPEVQLDPVSWLRAVTGHADWTDPTGTLRTSLFGAADGVAALQGRGEFEVMAVLARL